MTISPFMSTSLLNESESPHVVTSSSVDCLFLQGDRGLANRWNINPTEEDSQGANGGSPVQDTEPDRQVLPINDQQRNADRSQGVDHSCGREELNLMSYHLYRQVSSLRFRQTATLNVKY